MVTIKIHLNYKNSYKFWPFSETFYFLLAFRLNNVQNYLKLFCELSFAMRNFKK